MKTCWQAALATAATLALSGCGQTSAGNNQTEIPQQQVDQPQQQAARDWYRDHQNNLPDGLRREDRLSVAEESRLREGAVLDNDIRERVRPVPPDLSHQLPPPPRDHRYVAIGGHIGLIDNNFQIKGIIHLHDR